MVLNTMIKSSYIIIMLPIFRPRLVVMISITLLLYAF